MDCILAMASAQTECGNDHVKSSSAHLDRMANRIRDIIDRVRTIPNDGNPDSQQCFFPPSFYFNHMFSTFIGISSKA